MDFISGLNTTEVAMCVTLLPTISMLLCSAYFYNLSVNSMIEACLQNFAAGLIIAAVAMELFPIMKNTAMNNSPLECTCGIILGFTFGLLLVHGVDDLVSFLLDKKDQITNGEGLDTSNSNSNGDYNKINDSDDIEKNANDTKKRNDLSGSFDIFEDDNDNTSVGSSVSSDDNDYKISIEIAKNRHKQNNDRWKEDAIEESSLLIGLPQHRKHIREHLVEIQQSILLMQKHSELLSRGGSSQVKLNLQDMEQNAELIDEEVHKLQYKIDHTRRLLEGHETSLLNERIRRVSKSLIGSSMINPLNDQSNNDIICNSSSIQGELLAAPTHPIVWLSENRKKAMKNKLEKLGKLAMHIINHLDEGSFDVETIKEVHSHIDEVEKHLLFFHDDVEKAFSKWRGSKKALPNVPAGAIIPLALVVPVVVDAMIDGFLIGISVAISTTGGFILALANVAEMGFMGIAFSLRVAKCTGSSSFLRVITMIAPPLSMLGMSTVGALAGNWATSHTLMFEFFVSFGITVLLSLACGELLVEAAHADGNEGQWWIVSQTLVGVFAVIMIDMITDVIMKS